jgi:hypothetical protein
MSGGSSTPKYDGETLRALAVRIDMIRQSSPEPKIGTTEKRCQAAYYAGWDDASHLIDTLIQKMMVVRL